MKGRDPRDAPWTFTPPAHLRRSAQWSTRSRPVERSRDRARHPRPAQQRTRSAISCTACRDGCRMQRDPLLPLARARDWVDSRERAVRPMPGGRPSAESARQHLAPWPNNSATWIGEVQKRISKSRVGADNSSGSFTNGYWGTTLPYQLPPAVNLLERWPTTEGGRSLALRRRGGIRLHHDSFGGKNPTRTSWWAAWRRRSTSTMPPRSTRSRLDRHPGNDSARATGSRTRSTGRTSSRIRRLLHLTADWAADRRRSGQLPVRRRGGFPDGDIGARGRRTSFPRRHPDRAQPLRGAPVRPHERSRSNINAAPGTSTRVATVVGLHTWERETGRRVRRATGRHGTHLAGSAQE
jgi:hypothetical protein